MSAWVIFDVTFPSLCYISLREWLVPSNTRRIALRDHLQRSTRDLRSKDGARPLDRSERLDIAQLDDQKQNLHFGFSRSTPSFTPHRRYLQLRLRVTNRSINSSTDRFALHAIHTSILHIIIRSAPVHTPHGSAILRRPPPPHWARYGPIGAQTKITGRQGWCVRTDELSGV